MSNHNAAENAAHRKPKVSLAMTISQGLGGPKEKPKGVADGQQVNIPALRYYFFAMTKRCTLCGLLDFCMQCEAQAQHCVNHFLREMEFKGARFLEKLQRANFNGTVP